MVWFKVDDQLAFHQKAVAAGNGAMGLWVRAGSWSGAQLTDGFIPTHMVPALGASDGDSDALVAARLWHTVEGGFQFHEWQNFQPTRDDVEADRAAARERMQRVRSQRRSSEDVRPNTSRTSEKVRSTPTRPDPSTAAAAADAAGKRPLVAEEDLPAAVAILASKLRAWTILAALRFDSLTGEQVTTIENLLDQHGDVVLVDTAKRTTRGTAPTLVNAYLGTWKSLPPPGRSLHALDELCPECNLTLAACDAKAITDPEFCPRKDIA